MYLRTHSGIPGAFPSTWVKCPSSILSDGSYYLGPFPISLETNGTGHFLLPNQKWLWRMLLLTPGGWHGEHKDQVKLLPVCRGVKRRVLLVRQRASLSSLPFVHRSPLSPVIQYCRKATQRWGAVSFSLWSPAMPQYDFLKGEQSICLWGPGCMGTTPGYQVPGQSPLNLSEGCCHSTLSELPKDQSWSLSHRPLKASAVLPLGASTGWESSE